MNFVIDPNIVYIDEVSWEDETQKDKYLQYFLDCLKFIDECRDSMFFWSYELESLLWDNPRLPPWRTNIDARNVLVPIIYKKFHSSKTFIDTNCPYDVCQFIPALIESDRFNESFKELCGTLVFEDQNFSMLLGQNQVIPENSEYQYSCSSPDNTQRVKGENIFSKWLKNVDFINHIWPQGINEKEAFENIVIFCTYSEKNTYILKITDTFIRSILTIDLRYKLALINAIKQRLSMTRSQAVSSALQEETIGEEVRIRITPRPTSTRLHFTFENNYIKLKKFYGVGEHDDGL
ncbi:hypothetical protein YH65_08845 [Sulfurovum lithotrophicum]|uniref:Uncharacterized protein n=1 Tax=Sulfurovum lithotrophicum TaxID=206403 RepID=A0A7U4M244_9BACT|nr:hypothetical protein [Sulfurovum lithotrophicum]AKF25469.1 hypothetical protein YH65_08845 [Sulfurovum lithotrophicum]